MDIGHYTLIGQLPSGRYGAIWRARDPHGTEVVLKQLALAQVERRPLIRAVATGFGGLRHVNLARCFDPVEDDSGIWLVEEWVPGVSLSALGGTSPLSWRQMLGVLHGALQGLAVAHRQGLSHGDLSPRTIMVSADGTPKVIGCGAWAGQPEVAGISGYASPEVLAGWPLAPTADVYSAGAMLARAVLGQPVSDPASPTTAVPLDSVQPDLRTVLTRALSVDPDARQPDAQVLLDELDHAATRAFGVGWWTLEGLAAAVSSWGVSTAGSVGGSPGIVGGSEPTLAPAGGYGAVSGSINLRGDLGPGAVAGAYAPMGGAAAAVAPARRSGSPPRPRRLIAVAAAGTALVILAVVLYVFARPPSTEADPQASTGAETTTNQRPPTSPPAPSPTPTPKPKPSPTPTTSPTPRPQSAAGFAGVYRFQSVVTKSNLTSEPVGRKATSTWVVKTTCRKARCTTSVSSSGGGREPMTVKAGGWSNRSKGNGRCVNVRTGVATGQLVPTLFTRTVSPTQRTGAQITKMAGTERFRQLKRCNNQVAPLAEVRRKVTITFLRR
ncbi:hypothetical protein GCM10009841_31570 [Microlunatus panaciterrae]|uniref:Serine/threonine-protein kinase n=1 Tax=Microlunatus panaciterrae TaxID=400768 RepID=A0ABS2RFP8_9ACTN|nr:serine/threonine-protein kinase [Microlunatus panaciterrae]MBM7797816.1 serine/threonine-protein kinase [Microlunatus panaciterrae]